MDTSIEERQRILVDEWARHNDQNGGYLGVTAKRVKTEADDDGERVMRSVLLQSLRHQG